MNPISREATRKRVTFRDIIKRNFRSRITVLILILGFSASWLLGFLFALGRTEDPLLDPRESHLRNLRQLTFGGQNAEAYFSFDGKRLIFQSTRDRFACDQIYIMDTDGKNVRLVSTGKGRTTCGYFYPDGKHILYSSTHAAGDDCPPRPTPKGGYVWAVYPTYSIYYATDEGTILSPLTNSPGYNAEAVVSPNGKKIVFTSFRNGDLDVYTMNPNGSNIKRLTEELGYDGGAVFSHDSRWIAYRAYHPQTSDEVTRYRELLAQHLVEPKRMDIFTMRADGQQKRQVTRLGGASFAPCWTPDDRHILFSSNFKSSSERDFHLYRIPRDGGVPEQITFASGFNSFPLFSPDGKQLVFASNRNKKQPYEINIFIADWVP